MSGIEHRRGDIKVHVERESVCMGDDMECPHAHDFVVARDATLRDLFRHLAEDRYLPGVCGKNHSWSAMIGEAKVATVKANDQYPIDSRTLDDPVSRHARDGAVRVDFLYHSAPD